MLAAPLVGLLSLLLSGGAALAGPDHLMLGIDGPAAQAAVSARVEGLGGQVERCFDRARFCVVRLPRERRPAMASLAAWPGVRYAEVDRLIQGVTPHPAPSPAPPPPGDAEGTDDCPDQWELETIGAFDAWEEVDGTWAPVVAIQDTGFLTSHEELSGRVSGQYDYGNGDDTAEVEWDSDVPSHGTFIAGVIAGHPDNGAGRSGVAPRGQVNLQKIADSDGALYYSYASWAMADIAEGDLGVRVLSYSIASSSYTESFRDAVSALEDAGILLVTAAGNCGSAHCSDADNDAYPMYPGSFSDDHVVVVASSTREDGFNSYSHYGSWSVDLAAPGEDICSCGVYGDDDYYTSGGTSYATPLVAASAALLLEAHPDLTTTELARVLRASAEELPAWEGKVRSDGRLDLAGALHSAVPRMDTPADSVVDGEGEIQLDLVNAAFEGEAWLVLGHGEALDFVQAVDRASDRAWEIQTYGPGESVILPDADQVVVDGGRLTVVKGTVATHQAADLAVTARGRELGSWDVTARAALVSEGASYLNAPYGEGGEDVTGFLARTFQVRVTGTTTDTGWEEDSGGPPADDSGSEEPGGCGCSGARGGGPLLALILLVPLALRRRSTSERQRTLRLRLVPKRWTKVTDRPRHLGPRLPPLFIRSRSEMVNNGGSAW